ncbi:PREDICTED: uncharacterized protein LOC106811539 [Priapulus caudatus]|uniref:Uncharacterized protein LOC106811539 n=1 Tax=Priapulus caudatus TaxID=37621 RepID=A0ABM1EER8_PRICU|nr:PREDICTED: uncharacterized protein LOC106811539 [Priapulus caudatus]
MRELLVEGKTQDVPYLVKLLNASQTVMTEKQNVMPAVKMTLSLLTVELAVALVCVQPSSMCSSLRAELVNLWVSSSPGIHAHTSVISPRNVYRLKRSHDTKDSWGKYGDLVISLIDEKLLTYSTVESQCFKVCKFNWSEDVLHQYIEFVQLLVDHAVTMDNTNHRLGKLDDWLSSLPST